MRRFLSLTYLDLRVIGGHAEPHQAEWDRPGLIHVDLGPGDLGHEPIGGIEPGRPRAYDCHAKWRV
jgi:hypothetical protein